MSRFNDRIDIQTCRDQHVALNYLLDQLNDAGTGEESKVVGLLERLRAVLLHHLRLEDEHVYPRLAQSTNRSLTAIAQRFKAQMGSMAQTFSEFYARWSRGGAISMYPNEYLTHWKAFEVALRARMSAEDDTLYALAESEFESGD